jgi:uncharacterized membrane protein
MISDRTLRLVAVVLAFAGTTVAGYLTYVHYFDLEIVCVGGGGCETVQSSEYADAIGIPVALLGLVGYLMILSSLAIRRLALTERGRTITLALTTAGAAFSVYLTYLEGFVIHAWCYWCVGSAVIMTLLLVTSAWRWLRAPE